MFTLLKAEVVPLTEQVVADFATLKPSPTERELSQPRIDHLKAKAEAGDLITFHWSTAELNGEKLRVNGQHSTKMLMALNGNFPTNLQAHIDHYKVDSKEDLAHLFRQFDDRKSGRSAGDVCGAYQGLFPELDQISRKAVKIATEGIGWWKRNVNGEDIGGGDDVYDLINRANLRPFMIFWGDVYSVKTPELQKVAVVAAVYATYLVNQTAAVVFWTEVARGGNEYDETAPSTKLDNWLKALTEEPNPDVKPPNYFQACIYAWNAYRENKPIAIMKSDSRKGLHTPIA